MPSRSDWVLVLLDDPAGIALDPIRIMKGLFLAQMESGSGEGESTPADAPPFDFVPYSYGPFSSEVYAELTSLKERGLVEATPVLYRSYAMWALTDIGQAEALEARQRLTADEVGRLEHARQVV